MAIGVAVRLKTHPGKGAEFEEVFAQQAKEVRAEPGNSLYQLVKSRTEPDIYVVWEVYADEAAAAAHREAPHMAEYRPRMAPLIAPGTQVEVFEAL